MINTDNEVTAALSQLVAAFAAQHKLCVVPAAALERQPRPVIKWYSVTEYGCEREYVHPDCSADAAIISQLTGKKTIDSATRELLRDLSQGFISFQQVAAPAVRSVYPKGRWT